MSSQFINVGGKEFPYEPGAGGVCYFADVVTELKGEGSVKIQIRKYWFDICTHGIRTQDCTTGKRSGVWSQQNFLEHHGNTEQDAMCLRSASLEGSISGLQQRISHIERQKIELLTKISSHAQKELF